MLHPREGKTIKDVGDTVELLRELPLFDGVSADTLAPLGKYFVRRSYERGEVIWRQGSEANHFSFIYEGKVKILKYQSDGKEIILGIFTDGEPVGQIAVYQRTNYPASAVALGHVEILQIHRDHFYGALMSNAELMEATISSMMQRNRHLVGRIDELATDNAEQRLAMLFCKFAEKMGRRTRLNSQAMGVFIELDLNRRDVAELINTRVETAIRIMSRWNKEGPVRTEKDGFLIDDYEALERLAQRPGG